MNELNGNEVLAIKMQPNDADAKTIGEYLIRLVDRVWTEDEGFSGKRPFGNSDWCYELFHALALAGAIKGELSYDAEYDHVEVVDFDKDAAIKLINTAVQALYDRLP